MISKRVLIISLIVLVILGFFIGYGLGFQKGAYQSMEWLIGKAGHFLEIEVDTQAITAGIFAYEQRINDCYPRTLPKITIKNGTK